MSGLVVSPSHDDVEPVAQSFVAVARNLARPALPSMGDVRHDDHHGFPAHGRAPARTGPARDVRRISREREERRCGAAC